MDIHIDYTVIEPHEQHNMDLRLWEDGWSVFCWTCHELVIDSQGRTG